VPEEQPTGTPSAAASSVDAAAVVSLPSPDSREVAGAVGAQGRDSDTKPDVAAKPRTPLAPAEIVEGLRLHSPGLVEDLHALSLRQIAAEDQRESRLDAKAQGLLVTAGLSLTVAFTFGGMLLQHPEYLTAMNDGLGLGAWPARVLFGLYSLALIAGLLASVQAVRALYVSNRYRGVDERDVLNVPELRAADSEVAPNGETDDKRKQARYRRYMTAHFWQIWQQHYDVHETKASRIKRGQHLFLIFLLSLMLIGTAMAYAAVYRFENPPPDDVNGAAP
jgi:hypothetical protein